MSAVANRVVAARQPDVHLVVSSYSSSVRQKLVFTDTRIHLAKTDEDAVYEQDIIRNPGSTKPWLAYMALKRQHGNIHEQAFVMERACIQLPRSYKLWKMVGVSRRRLSRKPVASAPRNITDRTTDNGPIASICNSESTTLASSIPRCLL